jgi:hypothetical protein
MLDDASILDSPLPMIPFTACAIHFNLQPDGIEFWADEKWLDVFMHQEAVGDLPKMFVRFPKFRRLVFYHELMSIFASENAPVIPLDPHLRSILSVIPIR